MEPEGGVASVAGNGQEQYVGYGVSPSDSRHSAVKRMRYNVGVGSIGKIANDPPKVGRAIDYVAAAPWPPLGSPGSGQLLCERLTH